MSDLREAILDARYIDMISLADFVVTDCGLPDMDDDGGPLPQQNEIAAAIFRWAAMAGRDEGAGLAPAATADMESDAGTPPRRQPATGPANWPNTGRPQGSDQSGGDASGQGED